MNYIEISPLKITAKPWVLKGDLCRCCHAEGAFKDMGIPFFETSGPEVYSDMLRECMDINLMPGEGLISEITFKICELCVDRLRDASKFKLQVLACEELFKEMCEKKLLHAVAPIPEVKIELLDEDELKAEVSEDDFLPNYSTDFGFSDDDNKLLKDVKIKKETAKKVKGKAKAKAPPKAKKATKPKKAPPKAKEGEAERGEAETDVAVQPKREPRAFFRPNPQDFRSEGDAFRCLRCDKPYEKYNTLKLHIKMQHYKIPRHICPYCQKEFLTTAPFVAHKLEAHNIDDRHNCNACKAAFNTKIQLKKHFNNFHMLGERHKCEMCEYETFSFEGLYKHKYKHRTTKEFHCKFCRKSFLRKTTLDLHERIHTGDRRKVCSVCGQAFVQKASLNYHMAKYHPEVNF